MSILDDEFGEAMRCLRTERGRLGEVRSEVTVRQMETMALEFRGLLVEAGVVSLAGVTATHCGIRFSTGSTTWPASWTQTGRLRMRRLPRCVVRSSPGSDRGWMSG